MTGLDPRRHAFRPDLAEIGLRGRVDAQRFVAGVKQLKLLQDKLGDFNDTSSQIEFFTQIKEAVNLNKKDRKTLKKLLFNTFFKRLTDSAGCSIQLLTF